MPFTGAELRSRFLSFFEKNGHFVAKSSPLLPAGDATLLFTNAGMVQFKDVFTGKESRPYKRAASSQKCVRAGGKHNDLENVGRTARHHTLFEMLGNFSFGDYFKKEACRYAWDFLTKDLGIPVEKLSVTVFGGEGNLPADEEAERIWRDEIGVPSARISRHGAKDNFWAMGDTGPCGPCTEIHYDRGDVKGAFGGDDPEGDRVCEIWNIVFMQFDRDASGKLTPLPAPCVDTGMGLERLTMVLNGFGSNYDTDLLRPLVGLVEQETKKKYGSTDAEDDTSMRVIADHARTTAFLIADGVLPSNEGRGYVLRRIMRRAIRHGARLGYDQLFFHRAAALVVEMFGAQYPELKDARALIEKVVKTEEETFRRTLDRGLERFDLAVSGLAKGGVVDGAVAHDLLATYGFPTDLTDVLARERGLGIDWQGYEAAKEKHEAASAGALGLKGTADIWKQLRNDLGPTHFLGYEVQQADAQIVAIVVGEHKVDALRAGEKGDVLLSTTPFYGESGGQVGDTGALSTATAAASVVDTVKLVELHVHRVDLAQGELKVGDTVKAVVDADRLERTKKNHSATHLLHHALRKVLGEHVVQKGSLVAPDRLRFDFAHFEAMTDDQLRAVEDDVNRAVLCNTARAIEDLGFDEAKKKGAMALFGEKYGDKVRVVSFGPSVELCGGIHVDRTGDIGLFKIVSEGPLAAGVRRIEAVTGMGALEWVRARTAILSSAARALRVPEGELPTRLEKLVADLKTAEKELERAKQKDAAAKAGEAATTARDVDGVKVLAARVDGLDPKSLRDYADKLRDKLKSGVVALGVPQGDKVTLLVAVTPDLVGRLHAGKMVGEMAALVGGKGGGKPDLAQAGGSDPSRLDDALRLVDDIVRRSTPSA